MIFKTVTYQFICNCCGKSLTVETELEAYKHGWVVRGANRCYCEACAIKLGF